VREGNEKLATTFLVVKANALGQFVNRDAKRYDREKLLGISDDDDTTGTRKVKTAPKCAFNAFTAKGYLPLEVTINSQLILRPLSG